MSSHDVQPGQTDRIKKSFVLIANYYDLAPSYVTSSLASFEGGGAGPLVIPVKTA